MLTMIALYIIFSFFVKSEGKLRKKRIIDQILVFLDFVCLYIYPRTVKIPNRLKDLADVITVNDT